jgi:hypothetical protein
VRVALAGQAVSIAGAVAPARAEVGGTDPDAELRRMAEEQARGEGEVVEIFDQRPTRPIERGTEVRLTYEQLVRRGATDLASALRLLPDVTVRDAGRGGFNIDVRGGRKGSVVVLIDGVQVTDPYYGTFDVSSIPITDIVQIRMSPTPQTPLDGPGGSGGVIEVLTRDAIGPQLVIGRVAGDSLPSLGVAGMARVALARYLALRVSMSGEAGSRDLELPGARVLDESRHTSTGAARLEYRRGARRVAVDGFLDSRHYVSPPSETEKGDILLIDREVSARASVKADEQRGRLQMQGQAYAHYLARRSRRFVDDTLSTQSRLEDLYATRTGGALVVAHPLGTRARWVATATGAREQARVTDDTGQAVSTARGAVTVGEAATGIQYETTRWRLDGAAGLAIPIGVGASPWPEAKLVARLLPRAGAELSATGGYKGRVPTLRERFDPETGNRALEPERAWHGEVRAVVARGTWLRVEAAPFARSVRGIIRLLPDPGRPDEPAAMRSANLGRVRFMGVDAQARVRLHRVVELGASYGYIRQRSDDADPVLAMAPLDRLPAHRADGWIQVSPHRSLVLLARARHFGESFDKRELVPAYSVLDATITAPLSREYLGVLRIEDATDEAPETRKGFRTAGRVIAVMLQGSWQ